MREIYRTKIEGMSEVLDGISRFWVDSIKFEFQFASIESTKDLLENAFRTKMKDALKFLDSVYELFEGYRKSVICEMIDGARLDFLKGTVVSRLPSRPIPDSSPGIRYVILGQPCSQTS